MNKNDLVEAWVKAQSKLLFSESVWLANNVKWALSLKNEAMAQWNLMKQLFPDIPPFVSVNARTFLENALRDHYKRNYLPPVMEECYVDEDGFIWQGKESYFTPFGVEQFSEGERQS